MLFPITAEKECSCRFGIGLPATMSTEILRPRKAVRLETLSR